MKYAFIRLNNHWKYESNHSSDQAMFFSDRVVQDALRQIVCLGAWIRFVAVFINVMQLMSEC